jgi:ATP phosphoribosyltransferase regulatory subunit
MNKISLPDNTSAVALSPEVLVRYLEGAGFERIELSLLQPARPFLAFSGENFRRRIYTVTDPDGAEFCLCPDLTIAASLDYLNSGKNGQLAKNCYLGTVYRYDGKSLVKNFQVGVESFGVAHAPALDAEMLARAIDSAKVYGLKNPQVRIGDVSLFATVIDALPIPQGWKRNLLKDFKRDGTLRNALTKLSATRRLPATEYMGVLSALKDSDSNAAQAFVTDLLSIAGITTVGGRSVEEIAERFLDQAGLSQTQKISEEQRRIIQSFVSISGAPDEASIKLRTFAVEVGLGIFRDIDLFEERVGFLETFGVPVDELQFSTSFTGGLDYYTGFVFGIYDSSKPAPRKLVSGGRYDSLLTRVDSNVSIPAIGFAVQVDRFTTIETTQ